MKKAFVIFNMSIFAAVAARAVILLDTGDPSVNITAPTGTLANSGWQYEGPWGGFLGTPIAPNFFISAAHIGQAGTNFSYQGSNYTLVRSFSLGGSDLLIWQVKETFPSFAPLYSKPDELGKHLVVIGRGTERGSDVIVSGSLRGWRWGNYTYVERWGENDVAQLIPYSGHDLVYATFDQHVQPNDHPNEAHLSSGDSGGAVFINDSGAWKLAGINFSVDGHFYTDSNGAGEFDAALFDMRGQWVVNDSPPPNYVQVTGANPVPSGFYASRISSELAWIGSVIANPQIGREGNFATLTYARLIAPTTDITYVVEESTDLVSWSTPTTQDEILSTSGDIEIVKARIDIGTSTTVLLRLKVTRP